MEYRIMGSYQGVQEQIDEASSESEAFILEQTYKKDFGPNWIIWAEPKKDDKKK